MSEDEATYTGGCLCGAVRYEANGQPRYTGHCYCVDCRKASGFGFMPFMILPSPSVHFTGETRLFRSPAVSGRVARRHSCPVCGALIFGGECGMEETFTIYAGSLEDPSLFWPRLAIFTRGRPEWAVIPAGLKSFETFPE